MSTDHRIYRLLQRHLDKQTVGFPAALLGSDIRLLRRIFTPDEAKIALYLSYKPASLDEIAAKAAPEFSADRTKLHLDGMFKKGGIAWKKRDSIDTWYLTPMVVGIYENAQDGNASPEFLDRADAYMKSLPFGRAFMTAKPSQMRTIPINKSISMSHPVSTYDQIRGILQDAPGPFVVIPCICREKMAVRGNRCRKTIRKETCLAMNNMGTMILRRGHGREISRDEAAELFRQSEADGLVLQPSNAEHPEFVCSCCGCCCGMLSFQKFLPSPVDYWTAHYQATVDQVACTHCGKCVSRCQVNAVALAGPERIAAVDTNRCIGCGLCVATCPGKAITLKKKPQEMPLPKNEEALYDALMKNKKGPWEQWTAFFKTAVRIKKPWARRF
jgi:H+/Na+-translocating ferredoxin:NAD+ oxidoreductase subunit B